MTSGGSTTSFTTTPDGMVLAKRIPAGATGCSSSTTCEDYYLYDGLGSVVGLTDSAGSLVNSYRYDPYGNATSATETVPNPFRYIGAVWDGSTGLYQMGERYYDPSTARFTQEDLLGGGFGYAAGDPINQIDSSGLAPEPGKYVGSERLQLRRVGPRVLKQAVPAVGPGADSRTGGQGGVGRETRSPTRRRTPPSTVQTIGWLPLGIDAPPRKRQKERRTRGTGRCRTTIVGDRVGSTATDHGSGGQGDGAVASSLAGYSQGGWGRRLPRRRGVPQLGTVD